MSNNPLAGLSVPSLKDLAAEVVDRMGDRIIDLSNPLQRQRLKDRIEQNMGRMLMFELERAISAGTERAVKHVFNVMRDVDYQEKKKARHEHAKARRLEAKARKEAAEAKARMDYTRQKLNVEKATVQ